MPGRRRGRRGAGVDVDPARVRLAREERGLSLAELAGADVSRAFIHQVEHGLARPSREVLELIAIRTGQPLDFFTRGEGPAPVGDLSTDLATVARRVDRLRESGSAGAMGDEALRMVAASLRYSARVVAAVAAARADPPADQ